MTLTVSSALSLIMACTFGVFSFIFYSTRGNNKKSTLATFHSVLSCIMSFNYANLMSISSYELKRIIFFVHYLLLLILNYIIYNLILTLTNKDKNPVYEISGLALTLIALLYYIKYPIVNIINISTKNYWHDLTIKMFKHPSTIIFMITIFILSATNITNLFIHSKKTDTITRDVKSSRFLAISLLINFCLNGGVYLFVYFFDVTTAYVDISIISMFLFSLSLAFCQYKFYTLQVSTFGNIHKMVNEIPECVFAVDYNLNISWWNKSFEKKMNNILNISKQPNVKDFLFPYADDHFFKTKSKVQTNISSLNDEREFLFSSLPIHSSSGDFVAGVYYIQDITTFEKRKENIYRLKKNLEKRILKKTLDIKKINTKLKNQMSKKIKEEEHNFFLLNFDTATGLYNRKTITQKINALIYENDILYILYLDIDDLKMFNDSLGHDIVDKLILEVGKRIQEQYNYDKAVSRFNSDEFLIVLDHKADINTAYMDLHNLFLEPFIIEDEEIKITTSIGISIFPNDGTDANSLIRFADMAMHQAKQNGKNSVSFFDGNLKQKFELVFFISEKIKTQLANSTLNVFVEPIFKIGDNGVKKIVAFETVFIPYFSECKFVDEEYFFSIVRQAGLLKNLDRFIMRTSIKKVSESKVFKNNSDVKLVLSFSEQSFFSSIFLDYILETLDKYSLAYERIEIEISEATFMLQPELAIKNINLFKQFGINTTIKSFGIGYSSLAYLNKFNFHKIKINKLFVSEIGKSIKGESIIKLLILLSHRIEIATIAEGVTTEVQLNFLMQSGCEYFQGEFFQMPMTIDSFLNKISKKIKNK